MSIVLLAASFWDAATPEQAQQAPGKILGLSKTTMVVSLLDTLAHLQFCRMRLSAYSVLLQNLLQAAASSAEVYLSSGKIIRDISFFWCGLSLLGAALCTRSQAAQCGCQRGIR
jgi:hypothetical protein